MGLCASALLVPVFYLWVIGTSTERPTFDLSAGPPATAVGMTRPTWLHPTRIISEVETVPAPTSSVPARVTPTTRPGATPSTVPVTSTSSAAVERPSPSTTTTSGPVSTTTTRPGVVITLPVDISPVVPALKSPPTRIEQGHASWFDTADRTCAHRTAPVGTVVKVTRPATGESTTCEVSGWGPADTTRVIDLSMDTFELLAHADAGLIEVVIEW